MPQGRGAARLAEPTRDDTFVFDIKNGLRVWLSEAVTRGQISAHDAEQNIRSIDPAKATDVAEDYIKLLTGVVKDSFGSVGIAKNLVGDLNRWWGVRVYFKPGATGDMVIIKGWPNGRHLLSGTRYRVDNIKVMELQIGKPGLQAAAKESARFGIYLVIAVDLFQFIRDHNLAHLLGSLTVDIPAVLLASAIRAAAGTLAAGTVLVGTIPLGPALVAFGVGAAIGMGLFFLDKHFEITEKVTAAYERGLDRLQRWWHDMGDQATQRWRSFINSCAVQNMARSLDILGRRLGEGNNAQSMLQSLI